MRWQCSNCQLSEAGIFRSAHLQIFGMPNVLMWPNYHTQLFAEKTESTHWNLFCLPKCLRHVCDPQKFGQSQLALSNSNFATCEQILTAVQIFVHPLHFLFSQMWILKEFQSSQCSPRIFNHRDIFHNAAFSVFSTILTTVILPTILFSQYFHNIFHNFNHRDICHNIAFSVFSQYLPQF